MKEIISYAYQVLTRKKIIKYARQYKDINMAKLIGADKDNFPFVIEEGESENVYFWNKYNGIVIHVDEDPVRLYATIKYLKESAYPVFKSFEEAEKHAKDRDWPRKERT